jgi:high-affinity iron transporter
MTMFLMGLRDALEAALVIGLLLAVVSKVGVRSALQRQGLAQAVWLGLGAGLLVGFSVATAFVSGHVTTGEPALVALQLMALGLAALASAGLIVWLRRGAGEAAGEWLATLIAFLAVLPQVIELMGRLAGAKNVVPVLAATGVGIVAAGVLCALLYLGLMRTTPFEPAFRRLAEQRVRVD